MTDTEHQAVSPSVTEQLADFVVATDIGAIPSEVVHEAKRLLLHGLMATVTAYDHETIQILAEWAREAGATGRQAHLLWLGDQTTSEIATLVNAAQWFVLLLDETHRGSFVHPIGPAAAAALAEGECAEASGEEVLRALILGVEVGLAVTSALQPSLYRNRGFTSLSIHAALAAATASSVIRQFPRDKLSNALSIAMITGGAGLGEQAGFMVSPLSIGSGARNGFIAAQLADRGFDAPASAFEGAKGMRAAYSDETPERAAEILTAIGGSMWRITDLTYQPVRGDTTTPPLIECALEVRSRTPIEKLLDVKSLHFKVDPLTKWLAEERYARFGRPQTDLRATSDMQFCVAASWVQGYSSIEQKSADMLSDPRILSLRDRVVFEAKDDQSFVGAALEVNFRDGSSDSAYCAAFKGDSSRPMDDADLEEQFCQAADGRLQPAKINSIIEAVWNLDKASSIQDLQTLLVV